MVLIRFLLFKPKFDSIEKIVFGPILILILYFGSVKYKIGNSQIYIYIHISREQRRFVK